MSAGIQVSPSLEDYLETIYFLKEKKDAVRVTDVALEMNISKPSVNKAINTLKLQELVEHEHYGLLYLTEKGTDLAKNIAERHMVLKRFLRDLLGVEEAIAEYEACKIEHSMSADTIQKLTVYLENNLKN